MNSPAAQENADIEIILSEPQTAVLACRQQLILEMSGQGGGKTQNIGYSTGMFISDLPEALGFIGANTYLQLSQSTLVRAFATWKETYGFTEYDKRSNPAGAYVVDRRPPPHFLRIHHLQNYRGTISFYNGALIFLGSLDNYKAHDGKEFAWAHLDETKDTEEAALKQVIIGRLRQYGLWFNKERELIYNKGVTSVEAGQNEWTAWNPLYIHTSPALGGVDWLNKMFKLDVFEKEIKEEVMKEERGFFNKEYDNKAVIIYSTHHNQHNLPPNYIDNQKKNLADDEQILKLVYGYPFSKDGGEYFPEFSRDKHVKPVAYKTRVPVHITWDFNVIPYMTCLCIQIEYNTRFKDEFGRKHDQPQPGFMAIEVMKIRVYREYCLASPHNTTEAVCEHITADHDPAATEIFYYGDASGLSRIPGLGALTNFKIVEDALYSYLHNSSKQVKAPNVGTLKRRDLVNKILSGRIETIELEIDPSCVELIADMEHVKLGREGKVKKRDKKTGAELLGHTSDALEYLISEVCKYFIT